VLAQELGEQRLGSEDFDSAVLAERKKVFPVTGREHLHACFDRGGQDRVVGRVSADCLDVLRRARMFGYELSEQFAGGGTLHQAEPKLLGQHAVQLGVHELREDEIDVPIDDLLEQPARRSVGDERRDKDVRVAEDAALQP
jgi:hypothetical protein